MVFILCVCLFEILYCDISVVLSFHTAFTLLAVLVYFSTESLGQRS